MRHDYDHDHDDIHDRGLQFDLEQMLSRRRALGVFAAGGAALLVGCGSSVASSTSTAGADSNTAPSDTTSTTATETSAEVTGSTASRSGPDATISEETAGPFPGDGSNGPNVLTASGVVREDITPSFGDATGTAEGVPMTLELTLIDVAAGGAPLAGAAVYAWHCDQNGDYSIYSSSLADANYLRGVQVADTAGKLRFTSIFPGCYPGRWPHVHFEVYRSVEEATRAGSKLVTSQIAFPEDVCRTVYATAGYERSLASIDATSLDTDMVFSDGYATQLATASGTPESGMTIALAVGV